MPTEKQCKKGGHVHTSDAGAHFTMSKAGNKTYCHPRSKSPKAHKPRKSTAAPKKTTSHLLSKCTKPQLAKVTETQLKRALTKAHIKTSATTKKALCLHLMAHHKQGYSLKSLKSKA